MAGRTLGVADAEPTLDALTVTGTSSIGGSSSALVAFHGSTPVDRSTLTGTSISNAPMTISGMAGFSSCAAMSNLITGYNSILACLVEKGLMA